MPAIVKIPNEITVHIGAPDEAGVNVTLPFPDYVKNVASSEIYPTWPEEALRANITAQISFALNRVATEFYRTQGYDFDITNNTAYDQSFVVGRDYFDSISQIVDEIFDNYIRKENSLLPLAAAYCDGIRTTCDGLSQWGSVELAEGGLDSLSILKRYYGDDIILVENTPVSEFEPSYPDPPLRQGSVSEDVAEIQVRLNRISSNYPAIPKIPFTDGIFGRETEDAVKEFQRIFNLTVDGVVGKATWYKIQYIYNGVKRLNELVSEGLGYNDVEHRFESNIVPGDFGTGVNIVQYMLNFLSAYESVIPPLRADGIYGPATEEAVRSFQYAYGLPATGSVDRDTWDTLVDTYISLIATIPEQSFDSAARPYPGTPLRIGVESDAVRYLQEYLNVIAGSIPEIPTVSVSGVFDSATRDAVLAFQRYTGLPTSGYVSSLTWAEIAFVYNGILAGNYKNPGQYPGYEIS